MHSRVVASDFGDMLDAALDSRRWLKDLDSDDDRVSVAVAVDAVSSGGAIDTAAAAEVHETPSDIHEQNLPTEGQPLSSDSSASRAQVEPPADHHQQATASTGDVSGMAMTSESLSSAPTSVPVTAPATPLPAIRAEETDQSSAESGPSTPTRQSQAKLPEPQLDHSTPTPDAPSEHQTPDAGSSADPPNLLRP
ncbi:hypothetical protein BC831DRAFT_67156 [Entophlyctis helioformis]|nr:hypothetical protein BC831DRAFT_67156 [Entophlyctis helioformis]